MSGPCLAARDVHRGFFDNPVLRGVSIELVPGRIHALLGENGAGKSTLINLLSGVLAPDAGSIELDGRQTTGLTPASARAAGIAVVHQELSLTTGLSIAENVGASAYPRRLGLIDYRRLHDAAAEACAMVGLQEDLARPVGELPLGRRQLVEIAKALHGRPRVLILDEPTSSLSAGEASTLAALIRRLREAGLAILYISHRLGEVTALCDHVTVLKDGRCTADQALAGTPPESLVRLMVGRDPGDLFPSWKPVRERRPVARLQGFAAGSVKDVDLELSSGEILGIGGLVGQGQDDLLLGLYGALTGAGDGEIGGRSGVPRSVIDANRRGIIYVPADRRHQGLLQTHAIGFNLLLPGLARGGGLRRRRFEDERGLVGRLTASLGIDGDPRRAAQALSGGNQQKVAFAKWLSHEPAILLLNDPTRGVDVETKREIYLMLRDLAARGAAIVLASSDTPELVHLCDRVGVMAEGRIVRRLERDELSEAAIVGAAMGLGEERLAA